MILKRLWLPLLAMMMVTALMPAAGLVDSDRETRWHRLHQGFTRQYIEECLSRLDQPGWSLEDEADLAMGYWWLMAEDFNNRSVQDQLFTAVERGIRRCRNSLDRKSCSPEHLALMGNLVTMASQVQVARGNYLSAARYAREGKEMLEEVRSTSPEIGDTYFSLGLYLYYVDLSSPLVRSLQRLLFFPPGDARLGLFYLEKTALQSKRFGPMARVALATIYSNGEKQHSHALSHLQTLRRHYPENPLFLSFSAEALSELGDFAGARLLLDEADRNLDEGAPPWLDPYHRNVFHLIRARTDIGSWSLDTAYQSLVSMMAADEEGPGWIRPVAAHALGRLYLLSGNEKGYQALLRRLGQWDNSSRHRKRMKRLPGKLEKQGFDSDLHQVFRHWISGDLESAIRQLQRLNQIKGNDGLRPYLLGELHLQRGEYDSARKQFRLYLSQGSTVQPWAAGWSLIRLGDIEAQEDNLEGAGHYYRQARSRQPFNNAHVAAHRLGQLTRQGS